MFNENKNDIKETKKCSKCKRILPLDMFAKKKCSCKNCNSVYISKKNGFFSNKALVKIERIYKEPIVSRILDTDKYDISLIHPDEIFVKLINYKEAWISNYGRVFEYKNNKFIRKRQPINENGEKVCTLKKNVYKDNKWTYTKCTVEVWRLVVDSFIVNYDIVGNTHCWHKGNNKLDNYYKNLYPVNEKQYNVISKKYCSGKEDTEEAIYKIINNIQYKADDWYYNKWKPTKFGVGYLGCNDACVSTTDKDIYYKWSNMMQRCYDEITHKLKPYYAACTVCIEWHNFSNFRLWYMENEMGDRKLDLDKDILIPGNTVYSPETCTLVTHFTNTVFEDRGINSVIVKNNNTGKYDVSMTILGNKKDIGSYDTEEDGKKAYADYKQQYIVNLAKNNLGKVPNKTYEAMMNWKVEIAS